jgi:chorismate-pyruvate lyase
LRRGIAIRGRHSGRAYAFAESLLVTSRLPSDFISLLAHNPKGLGESIDQMRLETRRELLWFGHAATPDWATPTAAPLPLLTRSYRIIFGGSPTILISESFPLDDPTTPVAAARERW